MTDGARTFGKHASMSAHAFQYKICILPHRCGRGGQFEAVYTVMNEFNQILSFRMLRDTSFAQLTTMLTSIKERYIRAGMP